MGWDWFYDATGSSDFVDGHYSTRIVPELQHVNVGDRISINDVVAYEVTQANPGAALVLAAGSLTPQERASGSLPGRWTRNIRDGFRTVGVERPAQLRRGAQRAVSHAWSAAGKTPPYVPCPQSATIRRVHADDSKGALT